ncbi:HdeA/HdeB family chaperone [Azospirillum halopraeferens]|uniref:HdeA/HdeB family chaperone n=1 Tax=Azospirillum halopraeferens TaxID=34010 RepID=UPI0004235755|nr:HdeA/HdeB family chaperone [Azospirillum halopraeferens]
MRGLLLTVLSGALLAALPAAAAEDGAKGAPAVDVATLACRDFDAMAEADAKAYAAVTVWLDGWLNGRVNETGFGPQSRAARAEAWRQACRETPDRPLLDAALATTADPDDPAAGDGFDMAFLKCYQFIDLAETDQPAAVTIVRWNDGWHAGAIGETAFTAKDHEKMADGFLDACANRKYHRRNLIRIMAGKYR